MGVFPLHLTMTGTAAHRGRQVAVASGSADCALGSDTRTGHHHTPAAPSL